MPKPKDLNNDETKIFICPVCHLPVMYRLPRRLKGVFVHIRCWLFAPAVLSAEVIL